jgi:hypothetical protein
MNEKLNELRKVIDAECRRRLAGDDRFGDHDVVAWLLREQRKAVIGGLSGLIGEVVEQWSDDVRTEQILRDRPELRAREEALRLVSQTISVPLWYLPGHLDEERLAECYAAARLISRLQAEEVDVRLEEMEQMEELHQWIDEPPETHQQSLQEPSEAARAFRRAMAGFAQREEKDRRNEMRRASARSPAEAQIAPSPNLQVGEKP